MLKIKHEVLLGIDDLSFDKQEEIRNAIAESIKEDKELMKQIRQEETNEWLEADATYRKKVSVEDLVRLRVEEIAMKHESDFRTWVTFETEIKSI